MTQFHADIAWFISATVIALVIGLRYSAAPARSRRYGWLMLGGVLLQAIIGYAQYFSHEQHPSLSTESRPYTRLTAEHAD